MLYHWRRSTSSEYALAFPFVSMITKVNLYLRLTFCVWSRFLTKYYGYRNDTWYMSSSEDDHQYLLLTYISQFSDFGQVNLRLTFCFKIHSSQGISPSHAAIKISINATAAEFICKNIFPTPMQVKKNIKNKIGDIQQIYLYQNVCK